jgi:hypothetical protein
MQPLAILGRSGCLGMLHEAASKREDKLSVKASRTRAR